MFLNGSIDRMKLRKGFSGNSYLDLWLFHELPWLKRINDRVNKK